MVNSRRQVAIGGISAAAVSLLVMFWAQSVDLTAGFRTAGMTLVIVSPECLVTSNISRFAGERPSFIIIPDESDTDLAREMRGDAIARLELEESLGAMLLGQERSCERLASEARRLAHGADLPLFVGPDGEDDEAKLVFRDFLIAETQKALFALQAKPVRDPI